MAIEINKFKRFLIKSKVRFSKGVQWCSQHPIYGVVVTISGVLTGFIGSIYSKEIKAADYFLLNNGVLSTQALTFWLSLLVLGLLFYYRNYANHAAQNKLIELIKTMPSESFLIEFSNLYKVSHEAAWETIRNLKLVNGDNDDAEKTQIHLLEEMIRTILTGVTLLSSIFDGTPPKTRYAANIMLYKPMSDFKDFTCTELSKVKEYVRFTEQGLDLNSLAGLLELQLELSTSTDSDTSPDRDDALNPLSLPIPENLTSKRGKFKYLPGAPSAFVNQILSLTSDTSTLCKWCKDNGDFTDTLCGDVESFFLGSEAENIKSFVSLPISSSDSAPIGVLNIHRNSVGLLREKEASKQFRPLMEPFISIIQTLMEELERLNSIKINSL